MDFALSEEQTAIFDMAHGFGQDAIALSARGARAVGAEPSGRMTGMAQLFAADKPGPMPDWVRGWSDRLPFASGSFDACLCKGAMDHFDTPERAIAEMARVTKLEGRVVLAIANFESLACRVGRGLDDLLPPVAVDLARQVYLPLCHLRLLFD